MSMPEATVYKNHGTALGQYDVRLTRQIAAVQTKTETKLVEKGANLFFRSCVG